MLNTAARLPTEYGDFTAYAVAEDALTHLCLVLGDVASARAPVVRVHSRCITGDVLTSIRCDCRAQLLRSLEIISAEGTGVLIYLDQEGRGIGLFEKIRAYALQDQGLDTLDANLNLGHPPDARDYSVAVEMLLALELRTVRLLTNNPHKLAALHAAGIDAQRVPLVTGVGSENARYMRTKAQRMDHLIDLFSSTGG